MATEHRDRLVSAAWPFQPRLARATPMAPKTGAARLPEASGRRLPASNTQATVWFGQRRAVRAAEEAIHH